jgi:hypothetical protein
LKNRLVGQVEEDQKPFGAGQDEGSGVSELISSGISVRGKNPGEECVDMRKRGERYKKIPTYFNPVVIPQGREDPATSCRQTEPVAPLVFVPDPTPRVEVDVGITVVGHDLADKRVV